jgi:hypothetical protein
MTVADLVIEDLAAECERLREEVRVYREMLAIAMEQQRESVQTIERLRRDRTVRATMCACDAAKSETSS